jgi:hypothetical protein
MISEIFGIEGGKLITPEDRLRAIQELNAGIDGTTSQEESLRLEYQNLLKDNPNLEAKLNVLPVIYSGKQNEKMVKGMFFCYALPGFDTVTQNYTDEAGTIRWYLYDIDTQTILEDASAIAEHIRSTRDTVRVFTVSEDEVIDIRKKILTHIRNSYLRRINAPVGITAKLRCWMALS